MGGNVGNEHHPLAAGQYFAECVSFSCTMAENFLATSGACATIASDALMNPFDGKCSYLISNVVI